MLDEAQDGGSVVTEPEGTPTPPVSQVQNDQQRSADLGVDALLSLLGDPKVEEFLARKYQSEKDRGVNRAQTTAQEAKDEVARLAKQLGIDPNKVAEAQRQIEYEDNMTWITQQRRGGVSEPTSPGRDLDLSKAATAILQQFQLDPESTEVSSFLRSIEATDQETALAKVAHFAATQASKPKPTTADVPPSQGGAALTGLANRSTDEIGDEMMRLFKNPRANRERITELENELKRRDKK